jgi:hypothetical protein
VSGVGRPHPLPWILTAAALIAATMIGNFFLRRPPRPAPVRAAAPRPG